ncbi:MAG: substrate-binding domain-containing protein, partial [Syntrophothermus sp.]
ILATTTSTQDTGLLDVLVPLFEKKTGYIVKTIAVGTGEALAMGERGEADVLLVHAPASEEKFMAAGHGLNRKPVMHNDFVLVGPAADPAGVKGLPLADALGKIASAKATFVSRGDDSGTHKMEKKLWKEAKIVPSGRWYVDAGQGMGETLRISDQKQAYTISDRGTYLALKDGLSLKILVEKDEALLNYYSVIEVNPAKSARINNTGAKAFSDFVTSPETQEIIRHFGEKKYGQPLFVPDADQRR